jgi:hypothetical protein
LIRELFKEVATVVDALIYGGLELKPEPKGVGGMTPGRVKRLKR